MSENPYKEKHFTPTQCKMATPVRFEDDKRAYIQAAASCDTLRLYRFFASFFLGGYVIREKEFEQIYSRAYFNTFYKHENETLVADFSVKKEQLKTDTFLLTFTLSILEVDVESPLTVQEFEYDDQNSFTGLEHSVPKGALAVFSTGDVIRSAAGFMATIQCAAVGNPMPNITLMKGKDEIMGLNETVSRIYIKSKVS